MQQMQKVVDVTCGKSGKADKWRKSFIPPIRLPPPLPALPNYHWQQRAPTKPAFCQMPKILTSQSKITHQPACIANLSFPTLGTNQPGVNHPPYMYACRYTIHAFLNNAQWAHRNTLSRTEGALSIAQRFPI